MAATYVPTEQVVCEVLGVQLVELGENAFLIRYVSARGKKIESPLFTSWAEAEANFERRVDEEDFTNG